MFALRRAIASSAPRASRSLMTAGKSAVMARPVMASPSIRQATAMAWRSMSTMSVSPASVQQPAPQWTGPAVVDGEFKQISLSDYRGKYVVFFWYPMDFTFVCPTEIIAFSDRIKEFQDIDTVVIGASCDSEFSHLAWTQQSRKQGGLGDIKYPLLADKTKKIARDYGVLLEEAGVTLRGLFIIDPKGVVRQITINDLPVGRNVDEVLRLVKAFKFTDEHGEVCPSSWTPGDKTIKPSVKDSKQYFESVN